VVEGTKKNELPLLIKHNGIIESFQRYQNGTPPLQLNPKIDPDTKQPIFDLLTHEPLLAHEEESYVLEDTIIPLQSVDLLASAITSPGYARRNNPNEDTEAVIYGSRSMKTGKSEQFGLFMVCDGIGGHGSGQIASVEAAKAITDSFVNGNDLSESVQKGNEAVCLFNQNNKKDSGSLFTGFSLREENGKLLLEAANVGDSSTVVYRPGVGLIKITIEDNVAVIAAILSGIGKDKISDIFQRNDVYDNPQNNLVTRSMGHNPTIIVDTFINKYITDVVINAKGMQVNTIDFTPQAGDIVLAFCDGLWEMVRYQQIEQICETHTESMEELNVALVEAALKNGGEDNVSVVAVKILNKQSIPAVQSHLPQLSYEDYTSLVPALSELTRIPEQLNVGDPVRVPVPSPHGVVVEQTGWKITKIEKSPDNQEMFIVENEKKEKKQFKKAYLERLNPKRIEDIVVDLAKPDQDPLGALRYTLQYLPEKGIQGSTGFHPLSSLNRMIDAVIEDPAMLDEVTSGGNGVFKTKLAEIITAMNSIKVGDPVLMPVAAGERAGKSQSGWTVIALDKPQAGWATVRDIDGKEKIASIAEIQKRSPRFICDIDLTTTPDPVKAVDYILLHWTGGMLQSKSSDQRTHSVFELRKMLLGTTKDPQRLPDVTKAGGLQAKIGEILSHQE